MRIELDMPNLESVMEGYEITGENRQVNMGELYLANKCGDWEVMTWDYDHISGFSCIVVRKVKPKIWRAEPNKQYEYLQILTFSDYREEKSNMHYESGNYFMPGTANKSLQKAIDAIRSDIDERTK